MTAETISQPTAAQVRKLRRLIADAAKNVPFYAQRFASLDLHADAFSFDNDLERIPELTKAELLEAGPAKLLNRRFSIDDLTEETTTGSTGQPFTQLMEGAYLRKRNLRFLGALFDAGYRPWQRLMLVTEIERSTRRYFGRWLYSPISNSAPAIAAELQAFRPQVLYGCTTPLRLLAEHLIASGSPYPRPSVVITTSEMLDPATRSLFSDVFGAPVRDFYGLTEMGLVAWQSTDSNRYILERNSILTEFIPLDPPGGRHRMLMTNLDLHAAPLIRYDAGDIALVENGVISGFEGRELDIVTTQDGSPLSPYQITTKLQEIAGIRRFKLSELEVGTFELNVEADPENHASIEAETREILAGLLGQGIQLDLKFSPRLIPDGTRKFRTVESRLSSRRQ